MGISASSLDEASDAQREAAYRQWQNHNATAEKLPDPIIPGTNGMAGRVRNGIITVTGPCGLAHSMNFKAASALASWLNQRSQTGLARDAIFRIIEDSSS